MKFVVVYCVVVLTWIALSIIGALGPYVNVVEEFILKKCLVNRDNDHISDHRLSMIDTGTCQGNGVIIDEIEIDKLKSIESYDVIFFVTLPVKRTERKMSRLFQYLLADIDVSLRSQYAKKLLDHGHSLLEYHISIGYRNDEDGRQWSRLASGNASRLLDCKLSKWGTYSCNHFPLFELWSCHHEHYLINLRIPLLPLTDQQHLREFKGISAVKDMSIVEIHQHPDFTKVWFTVKVVFFGISLLVLEIFKNQLQHHKSVLYLLYCLVFLNVPVELLTLHLNLPWMVVFNDFRHGLMIGAICIFCTMFIGEIEVFGGEQSSYSRWYRWCFFLTSISSVTFFIYEFCERGIQVVMPFYSIWGTHGGKYICYTMITIATLAAILFLVSLIIKVIKIIIVLRRTSSQSSSVKAKEQLSELCGFIVLTLSVCVLSVVGYVIPAEMYLLYWMHTSRHLSLYGALLMSNYGLWNVYVFSSTVLYSKVKSNVKLIDKSSQ